MLLVFLACCERIDAIISYNVKCEEVRKGYLDPLDHSF